MKDDVSSGTIKPHLNSSRRLCGNSLVHYQASRRGKEKKKEKEKEKGAVPLVVAMTGQVVAVPHLEVARVLMARVLITQVGHARVAKAEAAAIIKLGNGSAVMMELDAVKDRCLAMRMGRRS